MVVDPGVTVTAVPEVALAVTSLAPAEVPILPVPPENVGVSVVEFPDVMVASAAASEVATGAATTVTVVVVLAVDPKLFVTVRV